MCGWGGGGLNLDGVETCEGEGIGSMDGAYSCGGKIGGGGGQCGGVEDVNESSDAPNKVES
jgi:hypothetical protein